MFFPRAAPAACGAPSAATLQYVPFSASKGDDSLRVNFTRALLGKVGVEDTVIAGNGASPSSSSPPPPSSPSLVPGRRSFRNHNSIGLLLALYNANVSSDWRRVAAAAARVPLRAIVPVPGVAPPDPGWAPTYPRDPNVYRNGVKMLRDAGVEVYAYTHLRNLSLPCCRCCGNLTQFDGWLDRVQAAADFDGVMMDNNDAPWSAPNESPLGLPDMYRPAAAAVKRRGLGVWVNGPHVSTDGSPVAPSADAWHKYLAYSSFSTLFEMSLDDWLAYPADTNFSAIVGGDVPSSALGGYVLDIPDDTHGAAAAIDTSLRLAIARGLGWLYPTITCQHRTGSCTYASLPSYFDALVAAIEKLNS